MIVCQHLTVWQIYFLAFGNGSQTHSSAEQEIFLTIDRDCEGTPEVTQPPFPLLEADLTLACLDRQASFFSKTFPGKAVPLPTTSVVPNLETFLPLVREPENQLPQLPDDSASQVEGRDGFQGQGRQQGS